MFVARFSAADVDLAPGDMIAIELLQVGVYFRLKFAGASVSTTMHPSRWAIYRASSGFGSERSYSVLAGWRWSVAAI